MKPKKSFGQNFLTSIPARNAIVTAGNIAKGEIALEIGPGRGFLTEGLLSAEANVIALEADRDLIEPLHDKFFDFIKNKNIEIKNIDALKYDTKSIDGNYKLIANIPYNITGAIIEKYLSTEHKPTSMVILVQREVAERIVSRDGHESILSIAVAVYGEAKIVYRVSAGSFYPKPKVDSAVLAINNINNNFFNSFQKNEKSKLTNNDECELDPEKTFFKILRGGFQYKRKYLINNLTEILVRENLIKPNSKIINNKEYALFVKENLLEIFKELNIDERERAENVKIDKWKQLFSLIYAQV